MRERDREIRRRRHRREKARKARIRALIAEAKTNPEKKGKEAIPLKEQKIVQKPAEKIIRPVKAAKKVSEAKKKE